MGIELKEIAILVEMLDFEVDDCIIPFQRFVDTCAKD